MDFDSARSLNIHMDIRMIKLKFLSKHQQRILQSLTALTWKKLLKRVIQALKAFASKSHMFVSFNVSECLLCEAILTCCKCIALRKINCTFLSYITYDTSCEVSKVMFNFHIKYIFKNDSKHPSKYSTKQLYIKICHFLFHLSSDIFYFLLHDFFNNIRIK